PPGRVVILIARSELVGIEASDRGHAAGVKILEERQLVSLTVAIAIAHGTLQHQCEPLHETLVVMLLGIEPVVLQFATGYRHLGADLLPPAFIREDRAIARIVEPAERCTIRHAVLAVAIYERLLDRRWVVAEIQLQILEFNPDVQRIL